MHIHVSSTLCNKEAYLKSSSKKGRTSRHACGGLQLWKTKDHHCVVFDPRITTFHFLIFFFIFQRDNNVSRDSRKDNGNNSVCDAEGWRPQFNSRYAVDYAPLLGQQLVPHHSCTHYISWSMSSIDSKQFEESMMCPIVPFDTLRKHKFDVGCSSWDEGRGVAVKFSSLPAKLDHFASLMWTCEEEDVSVPVPFSRYISTNLCSDQELLAASMVHGCSNMGPLIRLRWGNAMLTHVKFIKSNPDTNSCVSSAVNHTRMTAIA